MRSLTWRGGAKTTSRHVAYVGTAGVRPELRAQARPPWHRCLRAGARARLRVSARGHACICTRSHTNARLAKRGCSQKKNGCALSEYEGLVRNRYRLLTPKTGPWFYCVFLFVFGCFANSCDCASASWRCAMTSTFGFIIVFNTDR